MKEIKGRTAKEVAEYEKDGPKLSGYILKLPILQSQNFNLLT